MVPTTRQNSVIFFFPKFVISIFGEIWAQKVVLSLSKITLENQKFPIIFLWKIQQNLSPKINK